MAEDGVPASRHIAAQTHAEILSEALPYMQRYDRETVVVKYGGHAMGEAALSEAFAKDIVLLEQSGVKPVVVHGGGPQIGAMLDKLAIHSEFEGGLRVTDAATIEIVEMVLAGSINKAIVSKINRLGGRACGISGKDARLVTARKLQRTAKDPDSDVERHIDLGFVGYPDMVDPRIIDTITGGDLIPVIAPIAASADGTTYNVNADTFAAALATAMRAKRLLLLTDVAGVLDKAGRLIDRLTVSEARRLIADGTITGGMIPKVESCILTVEQGVEGVVIINGRVPHAVLLELYTEHGAGTLIVRDPPASRRTGGL